ncbi:hypothetical protein Bcep1808_7436 (plasmid) [Burkholderia vietnamiensis G4]|uniref:Uncharacterized protein n=1 Tax=Burkholderia vietnamiensis (strain G4 / LMG 22486) TaxID=269482 RepID=A4JVL0_BURVG|nr:hypothetical protein Bcep1808_7436 [Burkholderia vietnamiensis G4]
MSEAVRVRGGCRCVGHAGFGQQAVECHRVESRLAGRKPRLALGATFDGVAALRYDSCRSCSPERAEASFFSLRFPWVKRKNSSYFLGVRVSEYSIPKLPGPSVRQDRQPRKCACRVRNWHRQVDGVKQTKTTHHTPYQKRKRSETRVSRELSSNCAHSLVFQFSVVRHSTRLTAWPPRPHRYATR